MFSSNNLESVSACEVTFEFDLWYSFGLPRFVARARFGLAPFCFCNSSAQAASNKTPPGENILVNFISSFFQ